MSGSHLNHNVDVNSSSSHHDIVGTLGSFRASDTGTESMSSMNRTKKSTIPAASGPIIAGNCISCMGMVRISHSLSVNTKVRCPHCQESFVLGDLLDQSLPPLEVVPTEQDYDEPDAPYIDTLHLKRDEQANQPEKPRVKFEIPKALKDGAKRKRRRRRRSRSSSNGEGSSSRSSSGSNGSNFVIPSSPQAEGDTTTTMGEAVERRRSRSQSSSSERGERSSSRSNAGSGSEYRGKVKSYATRLQERKTTVRVEDIFKFVGASMLAIPVAYLMLIWVFKADPFGVASPMSQVVPFAVPASMHAVDEPEVKPQAPVKVPSYLADEDDVKPFVPQPIDESDDRIAVPDIDPDEVFGQEFGL